MILFIGDTHHDKHQCTNLLIWMCYWAWHWPFQTPRTSEDVCEKQPEHSRQPFSVQGWFDISVTGVFIEQHRASLSPPFYTRSPFQPRHYWQPCSLTGKAIMSAHWQQIACCANRFGSPLAGAWCSSLCSDNIHPLIWCLIAQHQDNLY